MKKTNTRIISKAIVTILMVTFAFISTGCDAYKVRGATAWDWVWGVEPLESGAYRVWLRHDNIAGYCTADPELIEEVKELGGQPVVITYDHVDWDDEEANNGLLGNSGCGKLSTGTESSTPIFQLTSIKLDTNRAEGK